MDIPGIVIFIIGVLAGALITLLIYGKVERHDANAQNTLNLINRLWEDNGKLFQDNQELYNELHKNDKDKQP